MDLSLTWRGDYTVRAALALAIRHRPDSWTKAADVAAAAGIPRTYVAQILATLVRADLVEAHAGPQGGYRLRRDPDGISLLEIVEAGEGELRSRRCVLRGSPCLRRGTCAVHEPWLRAQEALRAELGAVTLTEVEAAHRRARGGGSAMLVGARPRLSGWAPLRRPARPAGRAAKRPA